jgi:hypothetical protein
MILLTVQSLPEFIPHTPGSLFRRFEAGGKIDPLGFGGLKARPCLNKRPFGCLPKQDAFPQFPFNGIKTLLRLRQFQLLGVALGPCLMGCAHMGLRSHGSVFLINQVTLAFTHQFQAGRKFTLESLDGAP